MKWQMKIINVRGKSRNLLLLTLRAKVICVEREKLRIGLDSSSKSSVCNTCINIMIDISEIDSDDE